MSIPRVHLGLTASERSQIVSESMVIWHWKTFSMVTLFVYTYG